MNILEREDGVVEISGSRTELASMMDQSSNQYHSAQDEAQRQLLALSIDDLREIEFLLEDMTDQLDDFSDSESVLDELREHINDTVCAVLSKHPAVNDGPFDQFVHFLRKVG